MVTERSRTVVQGSSTVYDVPVGILMLNTSTPRIPGDIGNARTWPFPVMYKVVGAAGPVDVVENLGASGLVDDFTAAAREMEAEGVQVITTSCGFLALYQRELQRKLRALVLTSSLLQVPWVASTLPAGGCIGVLTADSTFLTKEHLEAVGITPDIPVVIQGMEEAGGYFCGLFRAGSTELDVERARDEHRRAAQLLVEKAPNLRAIVLECTNMPPYVAELRRVVDVPIFDVTTMVRWAVSAVYSQGSSLEGAR